MTHINKTKSPLERIVSHQTAVRYQQFTYALLKKTNDLDFTSI